ncbi:DUF2381 family protein [Pyxidicoccus xibeiensis]|uniref:DUF2381 family protein n=1 Tax=Pyxidicoccus xibeiensis TaxID=2906759 RepID=UPI0020A7D8BF|nr:DUF2381 family protein [Pyxidicoccus xibeiensis]MCP3139322.1 DUF2381 family protein [Pyxidicoccus xibeiensis]
MIVLLASAALAGEREAAAVRTILLSGHPAEWTHTLYVSGQVLTTLRFEQPVNSAKTKMLGWEGRLTPLGVLGNKVVLEPIHDLNPDERIPLVVALTDGTEVSFLLAPPAHEERATDQQVNVFKSRESYDAVLSALYDALKREGALREETERLKKEETSVDHAFATLLVKGAEKKTPFRSRKQALLKDGDVNIKVEVFEGPGKAAAVIHLTNTHGDKTWRFRNALLSTSAEPSTSRPFALRMDRTEIAQGQSGTIAVVADKSAFITDGGLHNLVLEIFRGDGLRQLIVNLDHSLLRE